MKQHLLRRGELLAELFLQDLEPDFVVKPTAEDFAFDFLIGFANKNGGVNVYAVELKATDDPVGESYQLSRRVFERFANSNFPLILLVIDVKRNRFYYAWPKQAAGVKSNTKHVSVPVAPIDDESRATLRQQMVGIGQVEK